MERILTETDKLLRNSNNIYKSLFMESIMTLALYDSKGKLVDANKACLELINVPVVNDIKGYDMFKDPNLPKDAKKKYEEIGDKDGVLKCENITQESKNLLADELYTGALESLEVEDYGGAKEYAEISKEIYEEIGDSEGVLKCEDIIQKSEHQIQWSEIAQ